MKCVTAGSGGHVYKSHLPRLGPTQQILDDPLQIREELTSLTLSSKADAGIQQSPIMTDDNRNTCPLGAASGVSDLMSQEVAGRVEARSNNLNDTAGTSQDFLKVDAYVNSHFSHGNTTFFICLDFEQCIILFRVSQVGHHARSRENYFTRGDATREGERIVRDFSQRIFWSLNDFYCTAFFQIF